jgi:hypothetical protein
MIRGAPVSDELFEAGQTIAHRPAPKETYGLFHFAYLAAIGTATIGWFWLIGSFISSAMI